MEGSRISVGFSLQNSPVSGEDAVTVMRNVELAEMNRRKQALEKELAAKGDAGQTNTPEYARMHAEIESLTARIADASGRASSTGQRRSTFQHERKPLIDTTFTMDIGETVVVGTSRMSGASRAVIGLVTAVPPRAGERRED